VKTAQQIIDETIASFFETTARLSRLTPGFDQG
jgi:hypothetical protein